MKKYILSLVALVLGICASAQSLSKLSLPPTQRLLGYYLNDDLATQGSGTPTWGACENAKAALEFTADMLKPYAGCKIVAIRFGICQPLTKSRVFIAPAETLEKETDDFVSKDVPAPEVGWNYITLDEPFDIDGKQEIIVGYDYQQRDDKYMGGIFRPECYPLSMVVEGLNTKGSLLYTNKRGTVGWYEQGKGANLSIQIIIEGDFNDYCAIPFDFGTVATEVDKDTVAKIRIMNNGTSAIERLSYITTVDGKAATEKEITLDSPIDEGTSGFIYADIPAIGEYARKAVSVEITKVNGNDNKAKTKVAKGYAGAAKEFYPRNLVIEEFTTEKCSNCPAAAERLHEALQSLDQTKVFPVCHHSGFGTDWLTKECDTELVGMMYGNKGGFAPAVGFNRDYNLIAEEDNNRRGNVTNPVSTELIKIYANNALTKVANSELKMEVVKNSDDTQATVIITGKCNEAFDVDNGLLTLYVTEDDIPAHSQTGASGDFMHMHVIRYYNSVWGDKVEWDGNGSFSATYNVDLDPEWNKEKLNFVAFLNKYDEYDYTNNKIDNSVGIAYKDITAGINGISNSGNAEEIARYTVNGIKVSTPVKGLNILKTSDGRTLKVMVK